MGRGWEGLLIGRGLVGSIDLDGVWGFWGSGERSRHKGGAVVDHRVAEVRQPILHGDPSVLINGGKGGGEASRVY